MADTLTNLRTRIRRRADRENDPHIVDAELTQFINASYKELWDLLVAASSDYFLSSETYTLTGTTDTRALPSGCYKVRGIDWLNGRYEALPRFTFSSRNLCNQRMYRVLGTNVQFLPLGDAAGSYRTWYEPGPTALSADADALNDAVDMWDEYIVIDGAIKCYGKSQDDASQFMSEKHAMKARIEAMAPDRDHGSPDRVSDVNAASDWDF
ncbi:MAG: hypothetical protein M3R04_03240 [bacterium]|nr:hypothetical protein [bacterium]